MFGFFVGMIGGCHCIPNCTRNGPLPYGVPNIIAGGRQRDSVIEGNTPPKNERKGLGLGGTFKCSDGWGLSVFVC